MSRSPSPASRYDDEPGDATHPAPQQVPRARPAALRPVAGSGPAAGPVDPAGPETVATTADARPNTLRTAGSPAVPATGASAPDVVEDLRGALHDLTRLHRQAARALAGARVRPVPADLEQQLRGLTEGLRRTEERLTTRLHGVTGGRPAGSAPAPHRAGTRGAGTPSGGGRGWASLTAAELDVVGVITQGMTNKEAAALLFLSPHTVGSHLRHAYAKLGINSRVELVHLALGHGSPADRTAG